MAARIDRRVHRSIRRTLSQRRAAVADEGKSSKPIKDTSPAPTALCGIKERQSAIGRWSFTQKSAVNGGRAEQSSIVCAQTRRHSCQSHDGHSSDRNRFRRLERFMVSHQIFRSRRDDFRTSDEGDLAVPDPVRLPHGQASRPGTIVIDRLTSPDARQTADC